jgi:uncharacterized cupin superfamily protein
MVAEAKLEKQEGGLAPAGEGWFVVNVSEGAWVTSPAFGSECVFEAGRGTSFKDVGISVAVLTPGRPNGLYHREMHNQEDFLVLSGECLLLIEGEERALKAWDFVHCPPGTDHIFVGAGDGPCVLFMVGARKERATVIPAPSWLCVTARALRSRRPAQRMLMRSTRRGSPGAPRSGRTCPGPKTGPSGSPAGSKLRRAGTASIRQRDRHGRMSHPRDLSAVAGRAKRHS